MRHKLLSTAVLLAALAGGQTAAGRQVTLRWRFEPGQALVYRVTTSNETELPNDMGVMVTEQIVTQRWEVIELTAAGEATVRTSTDRVQLRLRSPMGTMEWDIERGILRRTTQTSSLQMTVTTGGQKMSLLVITNVLMELVEGA